MENKTQQSEKTVMVVAFRVDEGNPSMAHGSNLDLGQMTVSHLDCRNQRHCLGFLRNGGGRGKWGEGEGA
ncbi:hypothetical protein ACFX1Z_024436 [Malus domestica]